MQSVRKLLAAVKRRRKKRRNRDGDVGRSTATEMPATVDYVEDEEAEEEEREQDRKLPEIRVHENGWHNGYQNGDTFRPYQQLYHRPIRESGYLSGQDLFMPTSDLEGELTPEPASTLAAGSSDLLLPAPTPTTTTAAVAAKPMARPTAYCHRSSQRVSIEPDEAVVVERRRHRDPSSSRGAADRVRPRSCDPAALARSWLRRRLTATKYVTAVWETSEGLESLLEELDAELARWLADSKRRRLGLGVELQWSVPSHLRCRAAERKLKDMLADALRSNRLRLLGLSRKDAQGKLRPLPLNIVEADTHEAVQSVVETHSFQGVYRRHYPELWAVQHDETARAHGSAWPSVAKSDGGKTGRPLGCDDPQPDSFVLDTHPADLRTRTLLVLCVVCVDVKRGTLDLDVPAVVATAARYCGFGPGQVMSDMYRSRSTTAVASAHIVCR